MYPNQKQASTDGQNQGVIDIVYYTDPLCCWSWGFEPQWRKLRYMYNGHINYRYCMSGLLPGWNTFHDGLNAISRPAQMGPIWMQAAQVSGMPIPDRIWVGKAPPSTSYLSCIAVKCAALQSASLEEDYLRLLRETLMIEGKNIALQSVILQTAETLARQRPDFNTEQFRLDLQNGQGKEAFRCDLQEAQTHGINRFPTLLFRRKGRPSLMMTGYRPYGALTRILQQIAPELKPVTHTAEEADYQRFWGSITERELAEAKAVEAADVTAI
jgi:putative protein-disulfide isomerase